MVEIKKVHLDFVPASKKLKSIMRNYLLKAQMIKHFPWKKTAWATAAFPIELLWLYNIFPLHPENAACISAVRNISQRLIETAESLGFSRDLCSYMKTNIGAVERKISVFKGGVYKPTFMASTNTICDTHVKWFQTQARTMNVPYFAFDIPSYVSSLEEERIETYIDYIVKQFYSFFGFVKKHIGKDFDEERFRLIIKKSDELAKLWQEIYEYRKKYPVPYSFQETLSSIFPLVLLPGLDTGISFYKEVLENIKQIVREERGVFPGGEKYRLIWEGIPIWYKIRYLYQLANYGAMVVYEPYTFSFGPRKKTEGTLDELLRNLAELMLHFPYNYNLEARIEYFKKIIKDYRIDGVILHSNMSCRPSSTGLIDLKNAIQEETGVPVLLLQSDMNDPRAFSESQIISRTESFIEIMENSR